jgi:hypothetical protein
MTKYYSFQDFYSSRTFPRYPTVIFPCIPPVAYVNQGRVASERHRAIIANVANVQTTEGGVFEVGNDGGGGIVAARRR